MADGLLNKASIILTPTGYKAGTLYNVAPINEPYEDFDFARTSTATRINSSGLVSNVATGVPRINYEKGSIVNLLTYSEDLPQIFDAFNTQETYPYSTSPIGTTTSTSLSLIPRDLGVAGYFYTTSDLTQGQTYTFSCYYKGTSGESVYMRARALGSEDNSKEITFNGSWQREEITFVSGTSDTMYIVDTTLGGGSESGFFTFEVWGAQLELGSEATQYAPSFGSPGHRYDNGHILLEPTSTNLITYSEDFSQWSKEATVTLTPNYGISPDGTQNSTRMQMNENDSIYVSASSGLTASFYVKGTIGETIRLSNGSATTHTLTGNWDRVEVYDISSVSSLISINTYSGATARDVEIWGAQAEALSYATSYIPTYGSTVTRATETLNGSGNSTLINSTEGVLYAEIAALADDISGFRVLGISDGGSTNRIFIGYTSNNIYANVGAGTTIGSPYTPTNASNFHKVALKYENNNCKFFVDGSQIGSTTTSVTIPSGMNSLQFDSGAGGSDFYGKCKALAVFNEALSDAELNNLTG